MLIFLNFLYKHSLIITIFFIVVPTDALANKLFGVPEPSTIARSLPTTVPESPNYRNARTPRTPRTPQLKDPTQTPRFYPVVKEGRLIDAKVRLAHQFFYMPIDIGYLLTQLEFFVNL